MVDKHNAPLPQFVGEHMWVLTAMWQVDPAAAHKVLDLDNLLTMDGPLCYWCDQLYAPTIEERCPGGHEHDEAAAS